MPSTNAQENADAPKQAAAGETFMTAADLLPQSTAGFVRIPDLPDFRDAWRKMHIGRLIDDPSMKDFIDAQKARAENYFDSIDNKISLRPKDLFDIASGEVAIAWLPFANDKRRPYSICVIADIRDMKKQTDAVAGQIDKDFKGGGATRTDIKYRGETIRVYTTKPKPGQLKIDQVALTYNDHRMIVSDRESVIQDLLDAIAGSPKGEPLSRFGDFKKVLSQSAAAIQKSVKDGGTVGVEWFARPFQMGAILKELFEVDRGNQVNVLKLLKGQGFDAVTAIGGMAAMAGNRFDLLHHGKILANRPFQKGAQMLQLFNRPVGPVPDWVNQDTGAFNRINLRIEKAFWASEGLINEALGDEIFRDMITGIRDDEEGPQIDLEKNFLPHLDDQIILIGDNTMPAQVDSERMLVALRLSDAAAVKKVIRKAMEVEPDATEMDALPGVEIWRVQRGESDDDLEAELAELGFDEEVEGGGQKPLLDHWAIAVVDQGPGSPFPYLMFSSHPELLIDAAKRIQNGGKDGFGSIDGVKKVSQASKDLGAGNVALDRLVRMKMAMRVKYELLRQGKLKESDSVLSTLIRRVAEKEEGGQPDPLNAKKLPPLNQIEKYLPDGGAFVETTEDGWSMTGFFLK
ncbi:MAG: membrane or secreted protein [Pirellulaceae bacterium]|nr:membrane or secreted protein [Pirellulaceae bacterium]